MENLSLEATFLVPEPVVRPTPISAEASAPVSFYLEKIVAISHFMDLDDSHGSFDLFIIKEKMVEKMANVG